MANPLKVLTQLTASKEAQFAEVVEMQKTVTISGAEANLVVSGGGEISGSGAFKAAGAAQLGSSLDVKGAAALSGSLGVVGAANLQNTMAVAGVASFSSDVSASAGLDVAGAAHIVGALDLDGNLDVGGYAKVAGELSGSGALNIGGASHLKGAAQLDSTLSVDGNADFDGTLSVVGNISTLASASVAGDLDVNGAADVAGNLDVHGNAVVYGNLDVKGTVTTIESTTVTITDANIQLATVASPTNITADGAGITILGETNKTFQWNNDGKGFTSSEDINLSGSHVYRIGGSEVLAKNGSAAKLSFEAGAASLSVSSTAVGISGDLDLANNLHVSGTLGVDGVASFASDISASANMDVAGNINLAQSSLYKIGGDQILSSDGAEAKLSLDNGPANVRVQNDWVKIGGSSFNVEGAMEAEGTMLVAGVATFSSDITASAGLDVAGAAHVAGAVDMDSTLNVDGIASFQAAMSGAAGFDLNGAAAFHNDVAMDAALNLSGSAFINITTPVVDGKYNVNDAIRALDAKAGQQASNINSNYAALRFLEAKNFDAQGMAAFTSSFAAADIEQVTVDVLVQAGGSGPWTNDLVSVQVKAAGSFVGFEVSAPAMGASDKVRLIAVKESGSLA